MRTETPYRVARRAWERAYLLAAMERHNGNVGFAAADTGIGRTQFYRLLDRHGIRPPNVAVQVAATSSMAASA